MSRKEKAVQQSDVDTIPVAVPEVDTPEQKCAKAIEAALKRHKCVLVPQPFISGRGTIGVNLIINKIE